MGSKTIAALTLGNTYPLTCWLPPPHCYCCCRPPPPPPPLSAMFLGTQASLGTKHLCQHLLFCFIGSSHSGCEVIAIWIYLIISDAEHLLMSLLAICISLLEKCLLLGPFFLNWIFFFFGCWLAALHLFSSVDPWYMTCEYFPSFCRMPFHFVECFFCYAESFNFDEV